MKTMNKLFENILKEAFTDEELDMDENEWLEQMRAARAKQIQDRQAKRDAEEKAKKDAEEKAARLARGEYTDEERKQIAKHNVGLLQQYIYSMKDDMMNVLNQAIAPYSIKDGNPAGFQPYSSIYSNDGYMYNKYLDTFPFYIENVKKAPDKDEEQMQEHLMSDFLYSDSYGKYPSTLIQYPTFTVSDLGRDYCSDMTEADEFHSGSRNKKAWKEYIMEGRKEFKDTNEIHDTLDCDAELFACVRWKFWESFGVMVVGACSSNAKNIQEAAEQFFDTEYCNNFSVDRDKWLFAEYAGAFYSEEEIDNFMRDKMTESIADKEDSCPACGSNKYNGFLL